MNPVHAVVLAPVISSRRSPITRNHLRAGSVAAAAMLACLLTACGGGDDAPAALAAPAATPTGSVAVTASLGAVLQADVTVVCAPTGATLGTGTTGSSGLVTVSTSGTCSGPVLVTVSGRSDGSSTYFDEALGSTVTFPAGSSLRAVVPTFASPLSLGVTPLTEIATRQALGAAGSLASLTATQASTANAAVVAQVLGSGVTLDILTPPTPWTGATAAGSLGTGAADRYAFYLAGLAKMGAGAAAPALAVTAALSADLADGTLSGSASGFVYSAGSLPTQLNAGLQSMATYANTGLQGALGVTPLADLVLGSFSPASGAAGDTITLSGSGFDPDPFHILVKFSNNLTAEVVSSSATSVVVKVPAGAVSGPIVVANTLRNQTVTSATSFTVTAPAGGAGAGGGSSVWVSRASPSGFLLNGLAYGAGRFVAAGFGRTLLTSTDGLSWTTATPPDTHYFEAKAVTWTGSQFVMVGDAEFGSTLPALIATSPDGVTWTRRDWTPPFTVGALFDVSAGGGKITAAGGTVIISSSDGGVNWTVNSTPAGVFPIVNGLAGNATTRVAVGRQNAVPTILVDAGSGWQLATGTLEANHIPADVTWTGTQFVAVGGQAVMRSADGLSWTTLTLGTTELPAGINLTTVIAVGSTLYATGDNFSNKQAIIKSADGGATWSLVHQATTSGNASLVGMAASADRVVTVGGVKSVTLP